MDSNRCIYYRSVSKIKNIKQCDFICSNACNVIKEYKKLVNEGKINIVDDIANFRVVKHDNKNERSVKNGSSNKRNTKRTLSKSRKKFKNKSK